MDNAALLKEDNLDNCEMTTTGKISMFFKQKYDDFRMYSFFSKFLAIIGTI